jgi:hypothetical protein
VAFDLAKIQEELKAAPLASPYPLDLAVAIVCDAFRMAHVAPPPAARWKEWRKASHKLWEEQVGMLAHLLATTSLRAETVAALKPKFDAAKQLEGFFEAIEPLTAEMIRSNAFRREEFLRNWVALVGGAIAGEGARESKRKLDQLDYRKTLKEYDRAEKVRKSEAERRAKLLKEAADREAYARGWRE